MRFGSCSEGELSCEKEEASEVVEERLSALDISACTGPGGGGGGGVLHWSCPCSCPRMA